MEADRWDEEELAVATEGGAEWVLTLRRERSKPVRMAKIHPVRAALGTIACEACGFDIGRQYGTFGADYIEVYHRAPLHVSGETRGELDDLALLCANCHLMIHRRCWSTVEALADVIRERRGAIGALAAPSSQ